MQAPLSGEQSVNVHDAMLLPPGRLHDLLK
jgi:hypothetical protein